jgi:hypothetical protein
VFLDLLHDLGSTVCGDGCSFHRPVALDKAKDDDLAGGAPAALALAVSAECGFIAFDGSGKHLAELLFVSAAGPDQTVKSLFGRAAGIVAKALSKDRHTKGKQFDKATLGCLGQTA